MARPDRIDFTILSDNQVVITKMRRDLAGPKRRDIPLVGGSSTKPAGFDLAEALAWCKDNGYTQEYRPAQGRQFPRIHPRAA